MTRRLHQDTTDAGLNLPVGPVMRARRSRSTHAGEPMAKYSAEQLRSMLAKGQAYRNDQGEPSYPIADEQDLVNAVRAVGRGGAEHDAIRKYIVRRARAMGQMNRIPRNWNANGSLASETARPPEAAPLLAEAPQALMSTLRLEGTVPRAVIVQEASAENGGVMRLKVPFYVGESIARAPGFKKRIYFSADRLPGIVQEAKAQIDEGKQPLTVYGRHAHATAGDHLPVGAVVDLEQEGRVGYAVLEVSPTEGEGGGRNVQILARNGHLNAVSLRSGPGRFELEEKKVNGEPMLVPLKLAIDGVDFAPDGPAQPTYGIQILQEAPRVEDEPVPKGPESTHKRKTMPEAELTLDTLRVEYPEIVAEIEAPLQRDLAKVTAERNTLLAERTARLREAKLADIASKFPEPDKALPVLQELCADCETDAQVAEKAFPVLLEALDRARKGGEGATVERPAKEVLLEMFRPGGAGQALQQEAPADEAGLDPAAFRGDFAEV